MSNAARHILHANAIAAGTPMVMCRASEMQCTVHVVPLEQLVGQMGRVFGDCNCCLVTAAPKHSLPALQHALRVQPLDIMEILLRSGSTSASCRPSHKAKPNGWNTQPSTLSKQMFSVNKKIQLHVTASQHV